MKIWWVNHGKDEFVVFDLESILLSISGYQSDDEDNKDYNFLDSNFLKINFPIYPKAEKIDISNVFWSYVPSNQQVFVEKQLIKTLFS